MKFRLLSLLSLLALSACKGPEADYMAVYQLVPDAHMLYVGSHAYLVTNTDSHLYWVRLSELGEVTAMEQIY